MTLSTIATYTVPNASPPHSHHPFDIVIAHGPVTSFVYPPDPSRSAIVNAANRGCLGGGGVDGVVNDAGGPTLVADRIALPEIPSPGSGVRCATGCAVRNGPNVYGELGTPYVIHAVGPNYSEHEYDDGDDEGGDVVGAVASADELLASAYASSMERGREVGIEAIAFCVLSGGTYRGRRSPAHVMRVGMDAIIRHGGYPSLKVVYLCGYTREEAEGLVRVADEMGLSPQCRRRESGSETVVGDVREDEAVVDVGNAPGEDERRGREREGVGEEASGERENDDDDDAPEEWEVRRDELKSDGDAHFRSGKYADAIRSYQDALQLDPTNHVVLSNMSAAHLANGEKSKALHDARRCVEIAGHWAKGHTRLAAAMMGLGRYNEAANVYSKVLEELDPKNEAARRGLEDCRSRQRIAREEKEREASELQKELDRQKKAAAAATAEGEAREGKDIVGGQGNDEDDLLDDFFSEVEKVTEKPTPSRDDGAVGGGDNVKTNRIKEQLNDLGSSAYQIDRLLQSNYEWKNLNPFHVLDMPHTIDDDSVISLRYRALSLLVHPDKCPDDPSRATIAFEQVRKAMSQMNDADKRRHVRALIEQGMKQGKRDWDAEKTRGGDGVVVCVENESERERDGLARAQNRATMKIFAEIEHTRRDIERRKREFEQRERSQEDEEKAKEKNERERDKRWREGERVEKRIGNWRDFQGGGDKGGKKGRLNR
ncbi:hypothetical protein ACHAW5_010922 [Stephanodiscus triporus]|uniref:Uncharacterized protein n=1 Tax=Stephanodiscus triporus TaxID=2934178 RepID=A0ABD3PBX8_9STRA